MLSQRIIIALHQKCLALRSTRHRPLGGLGSTPPRGGAYALLGSASDRFSSKSFACNYLENDMSEACLDRVIRIAFFYNPLFH